MTPDLGNTMSTSFTIFVYVCTQWGYEQSFCLIETEINFLGGYILVARTHTHSVHSYYTYRICDTMIARDTYLYRHLSDVQWHHIEEAMPTEFMPLLYCCC